MVVLGGILLLRLPAFLSLIFAALLVTLLTPSLESVGQRVATGFGDTCANIGLLIAMAAIISKVLLESGAAEQIVRTMLRWCGVRNAPLAFLVAGFVIGIPVFFDAVLLLLLPLGKAMAARRPENYLLYVLSIIAGASMAHSLVPPTPGPMAVASMLHVEVGLMILGGLVVGAFAVVAGFAYATWINRRMPVPLRESGSVSFEELEDLASRDYETLPPFWLALSPILLPILLVSGNSIVTAVWGVKEIAESPMWIVGEIGDKNVALAIGAATALLMLAFQKRRVRTGPSTAIQSALASAGVIILITAAGGAFGVSLQQAGVGPRIEQLAVDYRIPVLPLAFGITMLIRVAQGSATVAMITAGGILAGFATDPVALGFHPVYLALAIGCGSKPFPWLNDSGFWLISRTCGLTESETLKSSSTMISVMGCSGMVIVWTLAKLFPFVPVTPVVV